MWILYTYTIHTVAAQFAVIYQKKEESKVKWKLRSVDDVI